MEAVGAKPDEATKAQLTAAEVTAKEWVLAIGLSVGSNHGCYGKLLEDLKNDFTQGQDNYPTSLQQAYSLLVYWKQDPWNIIRLIGGTNDGMAFTNVGSKIQVAVVVTAGPAEVRWNIGAATTVAKSVTSPVTVWKSMPQEWMSHPHNS